MHVRSLLTSLFALAAIGSAHSASIYIGDDAAEGTAVTDLGNPDGAGDPVPGSITYGLHENPYVNGGGSAVLLSLTEVNFWADNASGGTSVTPFVASYNGAGVAPAANYTILAIGDALTAAPGVNNHSFNVGGSNPTISVNPGETVIAGFYQDGQIVPFGAGTGGDYLDENNELGGGVGAPLGENAEWSNLGRTYAFNVGLEVVPEPSTTLLVPIALGSLLVLSRRRQRG